MRVIKETVIHCSATKETSSFPFERCKKSHLNRGFNDIGYHFYIERDGKLVFGRNIETPGAHVRGHNKDTIGICYEGGLDANGKPKDTRTEEQKQTMLILLYTLLSAFPNMDIKGHRDYSKDLDGDGVIEKHEWMKSCPCFDVEKEYGSLTKK